MLSSLRSHQDSAGDQDLLLRNLVSSSASSSSSGQAQLLITCAELVHRGDLLASRRTASLLSASPYGDSAARIAYQFTRALSLRHHSPPSASAMAEAEAEAIRSSYLSFNQITPFLRFAHLTANQAILEAIEGRRRIHILDFEISHGVQWPPLLQAIAERSDLNDPPFIRITGTGDNLEILRRTGDRLQSFAHSLGLRFEFRPLLLPLNAAGSSTSSYFNSGSQIHPEETLAVNCVLFLHKMLKDRSDGGGDGTLEVRALLQTVRAMNPAVVTVAEREASHNSPVFLRRFAEALDYYTAVFESLEATLPPESRERLAVEQVWLGQEIEDVVGREGDQRRERHERFEMWEGLMAAAGFGGVPPSPFAVSQAKLLLRLHYPAEGYNLQMVRDSFFLGWQNKPLFSVSSWH